MLTSPFSIKYLFKREKKNIFKISVRFHRHYVPEASVVGHSHRVYYILLLVDCSRFIIYSFRVHHTPLTPTTIETNTIRTENTNKHFLNDACNAIVYSFYEMQITQFTWKMLWINYASVCVAHSVIHGDAFQEATLHSVESSWKWRQDI